MTKEPQWSMNVGAPGLPGGEGYGVQVGNRLGEGARPTFANTPNPVDWYQWGEEAFAAARSRQVPLLLSVGYASCHWCHVMAHESFEDPATAAEMNRAFVNVKVDREERPDVDAVYMEAVQALTGRGGWPMTVFPTPTASRSTPAPTSRPTTDTGCPRSAGSSARSRRRGSSAAPRS